jgi:hypothetical protein
MNRFLLFVLLAMLGNGVWAQDTTWVQTFTYDSITNRHDQFVFPASLDSQRFEKVLMYYMVKQ